MRTRYIANTWSRFSRSRFHRTVSPSAQEQAPFILRRHVSSSNSNETFSSSAWEYIQAKDIDGFMIKGLIAGVAAYFVDGLVKKRAENLIELRSMSTLIDQQWAANRQYLDECRAIHSQPRLYLTTDPTMDELEEHADLDQQLQRGIEANERYLSRLQAIDAPLFVGQSVKVLKQRLLADVEEQRDQLMIALSMNRASYLHKKKDYCAALTEINRSIALIEAYCPAINSSTLSISTANIKQVFAAALNTQAKLHRCLSEFDASKNSYEKALEYTPDDPYILNSIAWLLGDMGHYTEAMTYHRRANNHLPNHPNVLSGMGRCLYRLEAEKDEAQRDQAALEHSYHYLSHALELGESPEVNTLIERSKLSLERSDAEQALADLNRAYTINPRHPHIAKVLADTYVTLNRHDEANHWFFKALTANAGSDAQYEHVWIARENSRGPA